MNSFSPKSHLYRLGIVLVLFFVVAAVVREWATPASWNYRDWYRMDAVRDWEQWPQAFGGNESCVGCHQPVTQSVQEKPHKGLSCESCHGALADHVTGDKKIAEAKVEKSRDQCMNCHAEDINRPKAFPQFSKEGAIGKFVQKHKEASDRVLCRKCHDAHDPTS